MARTFIFETGVSRTQCPAVTTVVGETTEPLHRPLSSCTVTVDGSEPGAASEPPTTLLPATGPVRAAPACATAVSASAQAIAPVRRPLLNIGRP